MILPNVLVGQIVVVLLVLLGFTIIIMMLIAFASMWLYNNQVNMAFNLFFNRFFNFTIFFILRYFRFAIFLFFFISVSHSSYILDDGWSFEYVIFLCPLEIAPHRMEYIDLNIKNISMLALYCRWGHVLLRVNYVSIKYILV